MPEEALDLATSIPNNIALNHCLDKMVSIMVSILYLFSNKTNTLNLKKDSVQCLTSYYERIHFFFLKYRNYVATLVAKTEGLSESHGLSPLCNLVQGTK